MPKLTVNGINLDFLQRANVLQAYSSAEKE